MSRGRLGILATAALVLVGCQLTARSQIIETPKGLVEFVGLRNWDIATIEQRLHYESREQFYSHVQHDLTRKLGFAGAHCAVYRQDGRPYKVITVLEPEEMKRVRYLPEPELGLPTPSAWSDLLPIVQRRKFLNAMLDYGSTLPGSLSRDTVMSDLDEKWFGLLQQRQSEDDFDLALDRLARDRDDKHRVIAAMVLANFGNRDAAWWALVSGLRDANEGVRTVCSQTLLTLVNFTPRRIDWSPAAEDLNLLLSGTNLSAYQWVIELLLKTRVSPRLADTLLQGEAPQLLLAYLQASHIQERKLAHDLLARLVSKDFGYDGQRWGDWLAARVR